MGSGTMVRTGYHLLGENQACSDLEIEVGPAQQIDLRAGYDWHEPENNRNLVVFGEASPICRVTLGFFPGTPSQ